MAFFCLIKVINKYYLIYSEYEPFHDFFLIMLIIYI